MSYYNWVPGIDPRRDREVAAEYTAAFRQAQREERITAVLVEREQDLRAIRVDALKKQVSRDRTSADLHGVEPSQGAKPPLPAVDLQRNQVRFGDKCDNVTADGALLVKLVADAYPDYVPASKSFSKPSDIWNSLPKHLRAHIARRPGKGYRWEPS